MVAAHAVGCQQGVEVGCCCGHRQEGGGRGYFNVHGGLGHAANRKQGLRIQVHHVGGFLGKGLAPRERGENRQMKKKRELEEKVYNE